MGDFTGFSFGGVSSSELGITRVSGGDRYDEELMPEIKDITAEVNGLNGEYFFGSNYGPKKIDIEVAFDSLTEAQFKKLKKVFGVTELKSLIFDEQPYKQYMAKLESPIQLSYICFDEYLKTPSNTGQSGIRWKTENNIRVRETIYPYIKSETPQRVYKGEGKITFVCYFPFAKSVYKTLPVGDEEWAISSGMLTYENYHNIYDTYNNGNIIVYNAGDLSTGFRLYLPAAVATSATTIIYKQDGGIETARLQLKAMTMKVNGKDINNNDTLDIGVLIDTNNGLILGLTSASPDESGNMRYITSGNIYNEYVEAGYFFKLEPNIDITDSSLITIEGGGNGIKINYDYLYF